ncbi:glycoside hydrolase family 2 TIM barrel-domain containing protein [Fulvitalea axinellae]
MIRRLLLLSFLTVFALASWAQTSETVYLSGTDKDNTVRWDFFCTEGQNSGKWTTIPVPSCWESQGFGNYNYGQDKEKSSEKGLYKHKFTVPNSWKNKKINIVFEGSMTDTEVKINGRLAGAKHQGAFYRFEYDITRLLKFGKENLLEVKVEKMSSNKSVNKAERNADYWIFGGIFRPVYLTAHPKTHIQRVAIDAQANGDFTVDVFTERARKGSSVKAQVKSLDGRNIGEPFTAKVEGRNPKVRLSAKIPNVKPWNPEFPQRYKVEVALSDNGKTKHVINQKFGFRTVEVRKGDGVYVNDEKIIFKGVNRHCAYPTSGRTTSPEIDIMDINLMKDMNMNSVRMSHYPPDAHFLDACDSLGLFVLDELAGWQDNYDTEIGKKLVKEMVIRDVNHPSIILWDNGNEKGWNTELDGEFAKYDPQERKVLHPMALHDGMDTQHYKDYAYGIGAFENSKDIYFPTEFLHGLYDGGHGAGLDDHWESVLKHPNAAGGFLWVFADEGVVRTDEGGRVDTHMNYAPDGIVGPYREKEASYYTIREVWTPVHFPVTYLSPSFKGKLKVENRFTYTNLNQCDVEWKLLRYPSPSAKNGKTVEKRGAKATFKDFEPGTAGFLNLDLPNDFAQYDALTISVKDPHGREVISRTWPIQFASELSEKALAKASSDAVNATTEGENIILNSGEVKAVFSAKDGTLLNIENAKGSIPFKNGPKLTLETKVKSVKSFEKDGNQIVEALFEKGFASVRWTMLPGGALELEYDIKDTKGRFDMMGVSWDFPEDPNVTVKWLGKGPYRVWKNRLKGPQFGLWEKEYNNTITGVDWNYPEFKGYHSELYWAKISLGEQSFTVYSKTDGVYLRLYTPALPEKPAHTKAAFPEGNISLMHAIPAVGTKFHPSDELGPQGRKNVHNTWRPYQKSVIGKFVFDFRSSNKKSL